MYYRVNNQIKSNKVRLIKDGQNLGVFTTDAAKSIAQKEGLDLIEVAPNEQPPVCRIGDFGKFKYENKKKEKENKPKIVQDKEVRFSPVIDKHDIEYKVKSILTFLKEGRKVQVCIKFNKRQLAHQAEGFAVAKEILNILGESCIVESQPKMLGKDLIFRVRSK